MRCGSCNQAKVSVGGTEICKNNRCVKYARYAKVRCPECSCAPVDVESVSGDSSAKFRCPSDHIFNSAAASWLPMPTDRPQAAPVPAAPPAAVAKETKASKGGDSKSPTGQLPLAEIRDFLERIERELATRKPTRRPHSDATVVQRDRLRLRRTEILKELESVILELATLEGD